MKTTKSILAGVAVSLTPLMPPEVRAAFTENVIAGIQVTGEAIDGSGDNSTQQVYGTAAETVIHAGGKQIIQAGGVVDGTVVNSGGTLQNHGGEDNDVVVKPGGVFTLTGQADSYAVSNRALIEAGAAVTINNYVNTNNWLMDASYNDYLILHGASSIMNNTVINSGKLWILTGTAINSTLNSGNFVNLQGKDINTVINGGVYFLGGATEAWSENLTINNGAYGNLNSGTINNATINGSLIVMPNRINPDTLSSLQGTIAVNDGARLIIETGADTGSAVYSVSGLIELTSNVGLPGKYDFALGDVALAGGTVAYDTCGYSVLTMKTLSGSGTFLMNTRLAALQGDFLAVTGSAEGNFELYVSDSGASPASDKALQVIQTGGGEARFILANSGHVVDLGTYQYYLVADGKGGWLLAPRPAEEQDVEPSPAEGEEQGIEPSPTEEADIPDDNQPDTDAGTETPPETAKDYAISPATSAVLSVATVDPLLFRQELETLGEHLTAVDSSVHDYSFWGMTNTGRLNVSDKAGADYRLRLNSLTIGADRAWRGESSLALQGLFFSYGRSDMRFRGRGIGKADIDSWSGGLYGSWRHDAGYWLDGTLKLNRFTHEIRARMSGGGAAEGRYNSAGVGASAKAGKDFAVAAARITPWLAVTGFNGKSSELSLNNGMRARIGSQRSLTAAAGVRVETLARMGPIGLYPWADISVERETVRSNRVRVNDDAFRNDLSGSRGVYRVGLRAEPSPTFSVHMGAGYMQGQHVASPWNVTAGFNWRF
ncbi:autotransporter outer membrane beta-barrel domain-containing protein [Erwinia sp. CGal63]|uniref:autotransporter outer membrane beta-barrel domain-containing protein n=1 Tax=Erwinia sp. CGal63 TaxID=2919889 RepID=UPI00300B1703